MLSLTLQLLHFSSSFLTAINSHLYMVSFYKLCSTKQQKLNLLLKFQSNFNVDKGLSKIITLRSLFPMYYCLQSYSYFFFDAVVSLSLSHSLCSSIPSPFPLSVKLGAFSLCSVPPWESQLLLHGDGHQFYIFTYSLSPRCESDLYNFQTFPLSCTYHIYSKCTIRTP